MPRFQIIAIDSDGNSGSGLDGSTFGSREAAYEALRGAFPKNASFSIARARWPLNDQGMMVDTDENDESVWLFICLETEGGRARTELTKGLKEWRAANEESRRPISSLGLRNGQEVQVFVGPLGEWMPGTVTDPSADPQGSIEVEYIDPLSGQRKMIPFQKDGSGFSPHYRLRVADSGCLLVLLLPAIVIGKTLFAAMAAN